MSWSDLQGLDNDARLLLLFHARAIEARRRLDFIADVGALFCDKADVQREYLTGLICRAYPDDDDENRSRLLEQVTRMKA